MTARSALFCLAALAATAAGAHAQSPDRSADVRAAMARLPIAPGTWEGEAWFRRGPAAPDTILQVERVEARLNGQVLLIEGIGRAKADPDRVVHHAFATLGWDPHQGEYRMTAWLADGSVTDADAAFEDGVFTWGFRVPDGPVVRYRVSAPEPGAWQEDGEASMDGGETWFPFFGMTLHRTAGEEG